MTMPLAVEWTNLHQILRSLYAAQLFELRTIEGNAAVTVIHKRLTDKLQILMPCDIVLADGSLAGDGVAFYFVSILTAVSYTHLDVYKRQRPG